MNSTILDQLNATILARKTAPPSSSYTASLLAKGTSKCAEKFGEEAVEAVIAAVSQQDDDLCAEAADVLYHLLVLLASRDIPLDNVMTILQARTQQSGLEEKASR